MTSIRFVCCSLLVVLSWYPMQAEEAPLVWKFNVGDEHHYRMTQQMDMTMSLEAGSLGAADRNIETGVQQVLEMTWKIEQIDDQGLAKIVQSVDRVQMDMQAPGQQEMHYDTDADEAPSGFAAMLVPLFKAMTTDPFRMSMSPRGEISSVEMPESFTKAIQSVPGAAMMGEMFSGDGFKNMMQQSSLVLPKPEDLTPEYEWTQETEMKNAQFGTITTVMTYRYLGVRDVEGEPYEAFSIDMKMDFGAGQGGVKMDVVSQKTDGEILFSRRAGRLESSRLKQQMEMKISAVGQGTTQKMVQTVTFEHIEKQPGE